MSIIRNLTVRYCQLNPERPNPKFDKKNPRWEVQVYTDDPAERDRLRKEGLILKLVKYKEGHENEGEPILNAKGNREWKLTLNKRSLSKEGNKNQPVEVVSGANQPVDPDSIGNGSVVNCRVTMNERIDANTGETKVNVTLQGVQVIKHIVYKGRREEFGTTDYVVVDPQEGAGADQSDVQHAGEDEDSDDAATSPASVPTTPTAPRVSPPQVNSERKSADY